MTDMTVAKTILAQLGGNRFVMMTGAKNLSGSADGLTMKLGRNAKSVSHVKIKLTAMDDYTVEFLRVRKFEVKTVAKVEGVYAENLRDVFTANTGLYTSLNG